MDFWSDIGIPGLISWLNGHPADSHEHRETYLTQWHHRWAQPFNCLVVVMLATPLGVVFSKRGTTGGAFSRNTSYWSTCTCPS